MYIQEAHPDDGWQLPMNVEAGVVYKQPKTERERESVAQECALRLDLQMPILLDPISNEVDTAYAALPERLYVIAPGGRITYRSEPGPFGFDVEAFEKSLAEQFGAAPAPPE